MTQQHTHLPRIRSKFWRSHSRHQHALSQLQRQSAPAGLARKLRFAGSARHTELRTALVHLSPPLAAALLQSVDFNPDADAPQASLAKAHLAADCMRSVRAQSCALTSALADAMQAGGRCSLHDGTASAHAYLRTCLPKRLTIVRTCHQVAACCLPLCSKEYILQMCCCQRVSWNT
jgi:hypothetical protein